MTRRVATICNDHVHVPITVEIAQREPTRPGSDWDADLRSERTRPITEQDRHAAFGRWLGEIDPFQVGNQQVRIAVPVDIAGDRALRPYARRVPHFRAKSG